MNQHLQPVPQENPFNSIRHLDEQGLEFWLARELAVLLGYKSWQNFEGVIADAIKSADNSEFDSSLIFNEIIKDSPTAKRKYPIKRATANANQELCPNRQRRSQAH